MKKLKKMDYGTAHDRLGHMGEAATRKTAKSLGWVITEGPARVCESCALAKSKRKAVPQVTMMDKLADSGKRVYLDMSLIRGASPDQKIGRPNWRLIVDETTRFKISHFFMSKDGMVEPTINLFK